MISTDVLVVGAGPTGLALACGLRLHGVRVRVIDRAAGPATTSRANFVHARGSEVLDRLGALGTLPEESVRALQITTYLGDKPAMRLRFGDPGLRTAAPPMVVSQARVEGELRRRLAGLGTEPEWDTALATATQDADGVTAELVDGRTIRARWLIGCDGTSSAVRKAAGIAAPGVKLSERFLLADVRLDIDLDRSGTSGWVSPAGLIGLMPMPEPLPEPAGGPAGGQVGGQVGGPAGNPTGTRTGAGEPWRVLAYDPDGTDSTDRRLTPDEVLDRVRTMLPERTGRDVQIINATWLSEFTVHRRLADTYRAGRILLAGDAAHAHAPFGGQGMLTGLGDAENLAWKLALVVGGRADERLLNTYEAERRPLAEDVLRGTSAVTRIDVAQSAVGRFLRDRVLIRVFAIGWVQRWVTWTTSQLWVSYRKGPLGATFPRGGAPRPGDRIADVPARRDDGSATRLYAELGRGWALVVPREAQREEPRPGVDRPSGPTARELLGEHLTVLHRTETSGEPGSPETDSAETWLVRPDGHLAWRGAGPAGAARWLERALATGHRP